MASDRRAEHQEGPGAAQRFERTLGRVLTVSKAELAKREAAYKKSRRLKKARRTASR
jgi:predicted GIY-YIG superfamily endonuclease